MPESLLGRSQRERSAAYDLVRRSVGSIELAVAVGIAYFLVGLLGIQLLMPPERVAVFWPAAGISSGALIALGPGARWSVAAGVIQAQPGDQRAPELVNKPLDLTLRYLTPETFGAEKSLDPKFGFLVKSGSSLG